MARGKAQYKGDGAGELIPDFSDALKQTLRKYYQDQGQDQNAVSDKTFGHPADEFVARVLGEASWAKDALFDRKYDVTKRDKDAEWGHLLRSLKDVHDKLRNLSPDVDRLLGTDADPLGTADKIRELVQCMENAESLITRPPKARTPRQKNHAVAVEMTIRVLRVLNDYGIPPSATADNGGSPAIRILKAIGDDINLVISKITWRDIVREAKNDSPV